MTTFEIAQALGTFKGQHQITCSEKGYFFEAGNRIGKERAAKVLKDLQQPSFSFDKLNAATQAFFYQLCEQIQTATKDADMICGVKIGKDISSIGLVNAPRLTNLKKAGLIAKAHKGWVQLTEEGRAIYLATV